MKKTVALMMVVGFLCTAGWAVASDSAAAKTAVTGKNVQVADASGGKISQSFAGMVKKTDNGLVLQTKNGMYQLKGLSLADIVGKEVYVTGVMRDENKVKTIYVVKADIKE